MKNNITWRPKWEKLFDNETNDKIKHILDTFYGYIHLYQQGKMTFLDLNDGVQFLHKMVENVKDKAYANLNPNFEYIFKAEKGIFDDIKSFISIENITSCEELLN